MPEGSDSGPIHPNAGRSARRSGIRGSVVDVADREARRVVRRLRRIDRLARVRAQPREAIESGRGELQFRDNSLALPEGAYRAVTLRTWDPATASWSIWWLDGRHPHRLDLPMVGRFVDGIGTFFCDDLLDGRPIRVRVLWRVGDGLSPRWEQAFSADGGVTWETNWTMDFVREAPP